ncbi:conserved hypothetical protein [Segatella baroniae B14]|uniref:DNA 3'-5' helicase II n=2 Tax=Segatella TaxID=2974251 RepID=D8DX48_9BACT|nr:conserved hypothetical protein [Segatella baroniae B14]
MLDDQQRQFVENVDIDRQNVWIKGFPGSGKSVLLAYTMKKIKRRDPNAKVAVVVFTHSLIAMFKAAFAEMGIAANIMTYYDFMRGGSSYDYVLSDEIQDMTGRVLASMNSRAKHVIVAGDENQSIYDSDPKFREPTVTPTQITALLNSRDFELGIIHRLSSSIIAAVQKFLPNMNIFTAKRNMNKRTTQIRLCTATSMSDEVKYVMREAQKAVGVGDTAAILIPSHGSIISFVQTALSVLGKPRWNAQLNNYGKVNYNALNQYLASQDVKMQYVGNGYGSFTETSGKICLMTYHSSKGLDFDNVFLPGLNQSLYINSSEILSRTLFMVAMTRSRKNLYLTHSGTRSAYLSNFAGECIEINIHDALNGQTINAGTNNIFGI